MNPIQKRIVGSIIRTALAGIIPWLVSLGLDATVAQQIVTQIGAYLIAQIWSVWQKFRDKDGIGDTDEA